MHTRLVIVDNTELRSDKLLLAVAAVKALGYRTTWYQALSVKTCLTTKQTQMKPGGGCLLRLGMSPFTQQLLSCLSSS